MVINYKHTKGKLISDNYTRLKLTNNKVAMFYNRKLEYLKVCTLSFQNIYIGPNENIIRVAMTEHRYDSIYIFDYTKIGNNTAYSCILNNVPKLNT